MCVVINKPDNYKTTRIGKLPVYWKTVEIKDIASVTMGQSPDSKSYNSNAEGYFLVQGNADIDDRKSAPRFYTTNPTKLCKKGDLLLSVRAPVGTIAKAIHVACIGRGISAIRTTRQSDSEYLFQYLLYFENKWIKLEQGSTFTAINGNDIKRLSVPFPPNEERKKIAEILSTWDEAITLTKSTIEELKKRNKGLAQQLLTGKKRLKGFEGEWKEVALGEIFTEIKETNDGAENHHIMTISSTLGLITQKSKFDRIIAGESLKKYTLLQKGDFAYNKGNSKTYPMGCIYQLQEETALVPFVYICFRSSNKVRADFYSFWFLEHGLDRQLKKIITSGARGDGLLNVSKKDFFKLMAPYPSKEEQSAIASVLSEADNELKLYQQQLNTLQEQKKGLMQKLLTGEIRVKTD